MSPAGVDPSDKAREHMALAGPVADDYDERGGEHRATSSYQGGPSPRKLTPATDTNQIGRHDPLPDTCKLPPQVSNHLGHLCGIF
jgi:hypothetical protein